MSHESSNENVPSQSKSKLPRVPIGELIGFRMLEADNGHAVATMQIGPHHANPMGSLHGGVLCDIFDAAVGYAFASTLSADEAFTTVELKINFLRPVWNAEIKAEAKVVQRPDDRLRRMRSHRRKEPPDRQVGLELHRVFQKGGRREAFVTPPL